jgi:outer membrane protein assembly factor BamD (BamD/ComL family)
VPSEDVLIERAGRALREGHVDQALFACEQHARFYPGGPLTSTRDPLWIAALLRAGRRAEASQRIEGYAAAHPNDPQVERFRAKLEVP